MKGPGCSGMFLPLALSNEHQPKKGLKSKSRCNARAYIMKNQAGHNIEKGLKLWENYDQEE